MIDALKRPLTPSSTVISTPNGLICISCESSKSHSKPKLFNKPSETSTNLASISTCSTSSTEYFKTPIVSKIIPILSKLSFVFLT